MFVDFFDGSLYAYVLCILLTVILHKFLMIILYFVLGESGEDSVRDFKRLDITSAVDGDDDEEYKDLAKTIINHTHENAMANEISAPYELPHFPIEVYESRRAIQKKLCTRYIYNLCFYPLTLLYLSYF